MKVSSGHKVEDRIREELMASLSEDHLDLASIIHEVERAFGNLPEEKLQQYTLTVVYHLLDEGLIRAGLVKINGEFVEWPHAPQRAVERMLEAWEKNVRRPIMGEVAWFDLTPTGERAASRE